MAVPPVFTLAHELYPGKFRPTITHSFVRLLAEHGLLHMCFTQNIDTLERRAGVPADKIIEAHGSFADQHCVGCEARYDGKKYAEAIREKEVVYCDYCSDLVKPDIVFFGESVSLVQVYSIPTTISLKSCPPAPPVFLRRIPENTRGRPSHRNRHFTHGLPIRRPRQPCVPRDTSRAH